MKKYNYTETMRKMQVDIPNPRHGIWCARDADGMSVLITHKTIWSYNKKDGCYQYTDGNVDPAIKPNSNWAKAIVILREALKNDELVACPIVTMREEPVRYEDRGGMEEQTETKFGHWSGSCFLAKVTNVNDTEFKLDAVEKKEI